MDLEIGFYLALVSTLMIKYVLLKTVNMKHKFSLHYAFLGILFSLLLWNVGVIIEYKYFFHSVSDIAFVPFIGVCLVPPFFLLTGYFYAKNEKAFSRLHALLFLIPLITILLAITNNYHHLVFLERGFYSHQDTAGPYFNIHLAYSYLCLVMGLFFLLRFSIRNAGLFSNQVYLIVMATLVPFIVNLLHVFDAVSSNHFYTSISFTFSMLMFWFAILKYDFLGIVPIALQQVVNHISDGVVVVSKGDQLIYCNKAVEMMFSEGIVLKKRDSISKVAEGTNISEKNVQLMMEAIKQSRAIIMENMMGSDEIKRHYSIEVTPMFAKQRHIGTILLFKDITEHKQYIASLVAKNKELDDMNTELQAQNLEIESLNEKLNELAKIDGLTGAYNRRFFNEYYEIEVTRALNQVKYKPEEKNEMNFGIAILDIDNFKRINDTYGHIVGDSVLKQLVEIIKSVTFSRDIVCRYGGEEFAIIFTKTSKEGALRATEKIREEVERHQFIFSDEIRNGHVTVSIGFAAFNDDFGQDKNNLLQIADERLYKAKHAGKNRIVSD